MKKSLLATIVVIIGLPMLAQEVRFPPMILSGGGSSSEENNTTISRWRLSQVHVITLPDESATSVNDLDPDNKGFNGLVTLYPNPVENYLFLEFHLEQPGDYIISVTDVLGRDLLILDKRTIQPEQVIELNLSEFTSAPYFLQIESPVQNTRICIPVQKID